MILYKNLRLSLKSSTRMISWIRSSGLRFKTLKETKNKMHFMNMTINAEYNYNVQNCQYESNPVCTWYNYIIAQMLAHIIIMLQSIAAIAATLYKVKLLNNLAARDCICSFILQPTFWLISFVLHCNLKYKLQQLKI